MPFSGIALLQQLVLVGLGFIAIVSKSTPTALFVVAMAIYWSAQTLAESVMAKTPTSAAPDQPPLEG